MSRRLPVYLLIDTSGSMSGEPIEAVKNGVQMLVSALRQDPYALETAWLSVVTFDSNANVLVPLTELTAFQPPDFNANGTTALGDGLAKVADCVSRDLVKTTATSKGDWRPMLFLLTDGSPTDDWQKGLARFKQEKWGTVVACGVDGADDSVLKQISECVVNLTASDSASLKAFFKWISASVSQGSKSVEQAGKEVSGLSELPPPPAEIQIVT